MTVEPVELTTRTDLVDGEAVVSLAGDVDLASSSRLREVIAQALSESTTVILDASQLDFIDSSGLSALIWGHQRARELDGSFVVRQPSAMLRRLLEITRLETVLTISDNDGQDLKHSIDPGS